MEKPKRNVAKVAPEDCPFTFNFPDYGRVIKKEPLKNQPAQPCWFDLNMPIFNANIFLSYHQINSRSDFDDLIRDTYKINDQINKRSEYMEEVSVHNAAGVHGMKFNFEGEAASPIHFYLSDTTNHFVKGALYYNSRVQPDSMLPATNFITKDIDDMLVSFRWK